MWKCITASSIPAGSRVAIYGTGSRGRDFAKLLGQTRTNVEVVCFIDSFQSGELDGLPVLQVEDFLARFKTDLVLLASYQWKEMAKQLTSHGFDRWAVASRPEYAGQSVDCVYSNDLRFVLVRTPKCAARSLHRALAVAAHRSGFDLTQEERPIDDPAFKGFFKFAFVRNPWDRVVSFYTEKFASPAPDSVHYLHHTRHWLAMLGVEHIDFELYLRTVVSMDDVFIDRHCCPQSSILAQRDGELGVDFTGRFERLADDFQNVCDRMGIKAELPHVGSSHRKAKYREYYTKATRDFVAKRFARDIERFGYAYQEEP